MPMTYLLILLVARVDSRTDRMTHKRASGFSWVSKASLQVTLCGAQMPAVEDRPH